VDKLDFLDSYPTARRLGGGVSVASRISSFEITLSGAKGTKPADWKLFLMGDWLNSGCGADPIMWINWTSWIPILPHEWKLLKPNIKLRNHSLWRERD
jgi:hypothetical protein